MRYPLFIMVLLITLAGCAHAPTLRSVHDEVYPKYTGVSGMPVAEWADGRFKGNCVAFSNVVWARAMSQDIPARRVVLWRNEGDVLGGYKVKTHMVVISDGWVSDNLQQWAYPVSELYELWKIKEEY